jgi:hypothetical protein
VARPRKSIWKKLEQPETHVRLSVACGFKLANDGVDTRAMQAYLGPSEHPAYGALHRSGADPIQGVLECLLGAGRRHRGDRDPDSRAVMPPLF